MWRGFLISLGFLAIVVAGCDPQNLVPRSDSSDYQVLGLVAE
jgi:hypothetical protein